MASSDLSRGLDWYGCSRKKDLLLVEKPKSLARRGRWGPFNRSFGCQHAEGQTCSHPRILCQDSHLDPKSLDIDSQFHSTPAVQVPFVGDILLQPVTHSTLLSSKVFLSVLVQSGLT